MPVSKCRLKHLIRIRKIERKPNTNARVIPENDTDTSDQNDTDTSEDDTSERGEALGWYWHNSSEEDFSESDDDLSSETEDKTENEIEDETEDKGTEERDSVEDIQTESSPQMTLRWNDNGETKLRGTWGKGSLATEKRKRKDVRDRQQQASQCPDIGDMFKRARERAAQAGTKEASQVEVVNNRSLSRHACTRPVSRQQAKVNLRRDAYKKLDRLMTFVTEQESKYGYRLSARSNFYQRHLMVKHFLSSQEKNLPKETRQDLSSQKEKLPKKTRQGFSSQKQLSLKKLTRRDLAKSVAKTFRMGETTARNIVRWEKSWVDYEIIPARKSAENYESWIDDEDVAMAVRDFARKQGDSK